MPRDKTESHARVLAAARDEFMEYGFEKASMRRIGERCGMTAAGLYRTAVTRRISSGKSWSLPFSGSKTGFRRILPARKPQCAQTVLISGRTLKSS